MVPVKQGEGSIPMEVLASIFCVLTCRDRAMRRESAAREEGMGQRTRCEIHFYAIHKRHVEIETKIN